MEGLLRNTRVSLKMIVILYAKKAGKHHGFTGHLDSNSRLNLKMELLRYKSVFVP